MLLREGWRYNYLKKAHQADKEETLKKSAVAFEEQLAAQRYKAKERLESELAKATAEREAMLEELRQKADKIKTAALQYQTSKWQSTLKECMAEAEKTALMYETFTIRTNSIHPMRKSASSVSARSMSFGLRLSGSTRLALHERCTRQGIRQDYPVGYAVTILNHAESRSNKIPTNHYGVAC